MNEQPSDISNRLATAPVPKLLIKLAVPTVLAQLVNLLYNIVDRIYIGHIPQVGRLAMTGLGLCFPIICFLSAFAMLIGAGAPKAGIRMGEGNLDDAERILGSCFSALVAIALVLTAVFEVWGEDMLWLFGASKDTIGYASEYMRIYAAGSVFVMTTLGMNMFITTQGFTRYSMMTVLLGAVTNIVLDPVFIFALGMGVKGAALATIISQAASAVFAVRFLCGKKTKLRIKKGYLMPRLSILLPCMALGLSPFIMQATEAAINIAFNSSLSAYGGDIAVSTMTVASTILQMMWLPGQGIAQGAQPIISYNYGAKNPERIKQAFRTMLLYSAAYLMSVWALVQLFPEAFISLFNSDPALIANANYIRVYTAVIGFFFIQSSVQQTLMSMGKAKASLFIACMRKVILLLPLIYILPGFFENKVLAVFLAEPVSDAVSIITSMIVFKSVFGREMSLMNGSGEGQSPQAEV